MRYSLLALALLFTLPAAFAAAQTPCHPVGPTFQSYITERPVPYATAVPYANSVRYVDPYAGYAPDAYAPATYAHATYAPASCAPLISAAPQAVYRPIGGAAVGGPAATFRPVLPLMSMPANYVVGRGLLGQPKLYVPGQPLRNALRYLSL